MPRFFVNGLLQIVKLLQGSAQGVNLLEARTRQVAEIDERATDRGWPFLVQQQLDLLLAPHNVRRTRFGSQPFSLGERL